MRHALLLFLRANRRHLAELLLATAVINVTMLALPLFSMLVYDKAVGNQVHDTLWALAIGATLALTLELLLRAARMLMVEQAGARWDAFLDQRLMQGVLHAPLHKTLPAGEVMARAREVAASRDALSAHNLLGLADVPFVLLLSLALWAVAGPLLAIPLGLGAALIVLTTVMHLRGEHHQREANRAVRGKLSTLVEVLVHREHLGGALREQQAQQLFRGQALSGARAASRARLWQQWPLQLSPFIIGFGSVAVMVAGVFRVEQQWLSVGGLIAANMLAGRLLSSLVTVAPLISRWREFRQALEGLARTVDLEAQHAQSLARPAAALADEGIRLDQLSLSHPGASQAALQQLSLHLRPGELVAVVGACGGGKSTLLRVLAGHAAPSEGRLSVGAQRVADDADRRWLRTQAHLKPQEPGFWGGSVRDIVSGADPSVSDDDLAKALREAGLGPAMDRGELGLNSPIGSQGHGLSGGQKQSLALAQAFVSRAPVLLLDEPTLGLDRPAQERVLERLRTLAEGRCVLVATHAAEVIQRADRVVVLDRGRLVADGSPDRLFSAATHPAPAAHGTRRMASVQAVPAAPANPDPATPETPEAPTAQMA